MRRREARRRRTMGQPRPRPRAHTICLPPLSALLLLLHRLPPTSSAPPLGPISPPAPPFPLNAGYTPYNLGRGGSDKDAPCTDPDTPCYSEMMDTFRQSRPLPRHLSQHVHDGGHIGVTMHVKVLKDPPPEVQSPTPVGPYLKSAADIIQDVSNSCDCGSFVRSSLPRAGPPTRHAMSVG